MSMRSLLRHPAIPIWLLLVLATGLSWWLGTQGSGTPDSHTYATVTLLIVAFIKVRFIGLHFMELRGAPLPLRLVFEAWVIVVCTAIVSLYLSGPAAAGIR